MNIEAVHHEIKGIYFNQHPDPQAEQFAAGLVAQENAKQAQLIGNLAHTPNLNAMYAQELLAARDYFTSKNLQPRPATVFSYQNYAAVTEPIQQHQEPDNEAVFHQGYSIVGESSIPDFGEFFDQHDYILGLLLHEGAHGTMTDGRALLVSNNAEIPANEIDVAVEAIKNRIFMTTNVGGFEKYKANADGTITVQGAFIEEAFADFTRVQGLIELGREPKIDGHAAASTQGYQVVGKGAIPDMHPAAPALYLPAAFASAARIQENGAVATFVTPPNFAAYGLSLLNTHVPGLVEQMEESRRNPANFKNVINMIDSVEPGLYSELRELPHMREGFIKGLEVIQDAISQSSRVK
jgi:hypothetical protein